VSSLGRHTQCGINLAKQFIMCLTKHVPVGFLLWLFIGVWRTHAFATVLRYERETCLSALGKAQNKQAELARKLELAKKQQREGVDDESNPVDEMKEQMEHERFEFAQLLAKNIQAPIQREKTFTKSEIPSIPSNRPKAKSKSVKQRKKHSIEEENPVELSEKQPLKEGDVAKRRHFEPLVSVATKQPMGPMAAAQLVPWVPPYLSTYMIVLADPRKQSPELRSVLQILASNIAPNVLSQVVAISADLPEETAA
jgi:hypothetical protein